MRTDEMLKVQGIHDELMAEIGRRDANVSTLEITEIKKAYPLYDERMIYDVARKLIELRKHP